MTIENEKKFNLKPFCEFPFPTEQAWQETAEQSLKGTSFNKLFTKTYEGIQLKPLYIRKDIENLAHISDLPGEGSYVRGTSRVKSVENPWEIAQELTGKSPKEFNKALVNDLARGQTMINLVVDEATQQGLDSDQVDQEQVGKNGIPISTIDDIAEAFKSIDLNKNKLFMQTGISTAPLLATLIAYLKRNGQKPNEMKALIGIDPIGFLIAKGESPLGVEHMYNLMAQLVQWSNLHAPKIKTIYVQGEPYQNAGGSSTEELGFVLATAVEYISEMLKRGLLIDEVASKFYFSFSVGSNVFMEIAKLRAARMLWSKIVKAFGGNEDSQKMYIHARTSNWTKTVYDPYVNMLRATTEAFAGAVGGADSMHVSPFDEAIRPADSFSRRIARNTQIILQEESYLNQVIDPAGGSWYIESLTNEVAEKAWTILQDIERTGGMFQSVKTGLVQQTVSRTASQKRKSIEHRKDRIVGTNMYPNIEEKPLLEKEKASDFIDSRVSELKEKKALNQEFVKKNLETVKTALNNNENIMSYLIAAAENGVSIGQMISALSSNCEGCQLEKLLSQRSAEPFEQLRKKSEQYKEKNGQFPQIFFINIGPIAKHKARADFATGFFAAGGFESVIKNGFETVDEAIHAALSANTDTVIICGADDQYPEFVPAVASKLKANRPNIYIMLAGKPGIDLENDFVSAGVDEFIHVKSNCYATLARLQERKGVL
ncbi:methylmalonyl-CoA mutase family protein [Bacillus sp. Marseille-P3661]|uniref:methylmalonyl-CoA mutase family protein n=1 Tax=Bacillus sp. Marseille-P3661 TaxID=1936234 RepID=UPI000C82E336|nr:methylmalonyl-CoA mutase family protein [Bacillus sp. Marseille-P3661]